MTAGIILQATSYSYVQILAVRVVTGFGNGLNVCRLILPRSSTECWISDINGASISYGVLTSFEAWKPNHDQG